MKGVVNSELGTNPEEFYCSEPVLNVQIIVLRDF